MNAIEQGDGIVGLVRLKLPDEVQRNVFVRLDQGRPLALCFLHAVFAEDTLPLLYERHHGLGRMSLGNGDQLDIAGLAAGDLGSGDDPGADVFKRCKVWLIHGALL